MGRWIYIMLMLCFQVSLAQKEEVYVLVWSSTQTYSGAGHTAIAFKTDNGFKYYSHYPEGYGGGEFSISSFDSVVNYDNHILNLQSGQPEMVLKFLVDKKEYNKMLKRADRNIKRSWSLLAINCADFVKRVFRVTPYDTGLAFLISTPYEMVKDLREHNVSHFKSGNIEVVEGFLYGYLKKQPRAVPFTIKKWFGRVFLRKK